jgi:hypothetical protein
MDLFPFGLFPTTDDIHIIDLDLVVLCAFEHFVT